MLFSKRSLIGWSLSAILAVAGCNQTKTSQAAPQSPA
jgi:hypothetical protein